MLIAKVPTVNFTNPFTRGATPPPKKMDLLNSDYKKRDSYGKHKNLLNVSKEIGNVSYIYKTKNDAKKPILKSVTIVVI